MQVLVRGGRGGGGGKTLQHCWLLLPRCVGQQPALPHVRSGRPVMDAAAREDRDIVPPTVIASVSGNSTKSAEIRRRGASSRMRRGRAKIARVRWRRAGHQRKRRTRPHSPIDRRGGVRGVNRFSLANRGRLMLETARTGRVAGSLQGCSSAGRVPVSKTGCRRFEPCRPCQFNPLIPKADCCRLPRPGARGIAAFLQHAVGFVRG